MTLDEARDYITATTPDDYPKDRYVHSAHVDLYNQAGDEEKRKLVAAMEALVVSGVEWEQKMAAAFFNTVGVPPEVLDRLLAKAEADGLDGEHPITELLGQMWFALSPAQAAAAWRLFLADPVGRVKLAGAALAHDDAGEAWAALVCAVEASDDPAVLAGAYRGAYSAGREGEFFAAMKAKPERVVRETAALLSMAGAPKLLAACGLS
jgi:hypothetical protein